ncbi:MAG TPA: pilus assembly protein PilM [Solirubrobacteraceae bacterium]|nr:pilus assembly protein PilM [Solirubrobacteraceae bacterium]
MPSLNLNFGRRSGADVVGLDIQPGLVAAVQARVNGSVLAERAAAAALPADTVRDGEVTDVSALSDALRELFANSGLGKRVRVGVANQRTVLRTLELPPVTDRKELATAVGFVAQDQVPMPLSNAVMDFHALGVIDTPAGPRQRVVLVAAQRDMVERLLAAVRGAGLRPEGIDLSAFAMIRSLYTPEAEGSGRVLYLNVDGLTNLAIAEGVVCRFTRVVGSGLEGMASEIAERRGIAITQARELLAAVDLTVSEEAAPEHEPGAEQAVLEAEPGGGEQVEGEPVESDEEYESRELEMSYEELTALPEAPEGALAPDPDVRSVLERGIHDIAGEVRNSLDFHSSQEGGGQVSRILLSGSALDIPGFTETLQGHLQVDVQAQTVGLADESLAGKVSTHRLAIAAGLATSEVEQ